MHAGMPSVRNLREPYNRRCAWRNVALFGVRSNNAFERAVLASARRAASALGYCAPAARSHAHRAAAQRER